MANNPSTGAANIQTITAQIIYNGSNVGTATLQTPFTVKPNSNVPFTMNIGINDISTLIALYDIVSNKTSGNNIDITGNALVDGITVPISLNYSL